MQYGIIAGDRPLQAFTVKKIDPLVANVRVLFPELAGNMGSDEPGRAGHIHPHAGSL